MSAVSVRLGDVATFVRGITFKPADVLDEVTANAVGCMRTKNVQAQLDETDVWFLPKNFVANKNQVLQEGDLLVSTANSWNLVGKACWVPKLNYECTFGGFISVLRATDALVDRRYLYYWFTSANIQAKLRSFGNKTTNISNLSIKRANDLVIPLPPLAEQKRIAAILDKAAEIKAKREQAIAKLDELELRAFDALIENADGFLSLNQIANFQSGGTPSKNDNEYWGGDIAWISSADIVNDQIEYGRNFITKKGLDHSATSLAKTGKILVVTRTGVGKVAITDRETCYSQDIVSLNLKDGYEINFIAAAIRANKASLIKQARGATIQGITKEVLGAAKVPKTPANMQKRFSSLINAINLQRIKLLNGNGSLDKLTTSLQHQAFTTGFNA